MIQAFDMSWRQSEADICLLVAGVGVSDSVKSVEFFHFCPLFCSERDAGQSGVGNGGGVRMNETE